MEVTFLQICRAMPATVIVILGLFLLCLLAGWLTSIVGGFRAPEGRGLRGLLIFPITNPVALLLLLFRNRRAAAPAVGLYLVAVLCLPIGGFVAERVEQARLNRLVHAMEKDGESITAQSLAPAPVPPEDNVWEHPFLKPLAQAGQPGSEGESARADMSDHYGALSMPVQSSTVRYADEPRNERGPRERLFLEPFRSFHQIALSTAVGQELLRNHLPPETWEACALLFLEHLEPAAADLEALDEALSRPRASYPYAWDQGFNLLLPHLAKMKGFTQCVTWRSVATNAQGQSDAAFRDLLTGLRLIEIGDSDLLISRLVQWAQCSITLNAALAAQQYHAWNDSKWATLQARLEFFNFPGQVPDSMRAERVCGQATIGPLLRKDPLEIQRHLDQIGVGVAPSAGSNPPALRKFVNVMLGGLGRAFLTSQWRLALEAYDDLISAIEEAVQESQSQPWMTLEMAELPLPIEDYGMFAQMVLPALGKAFNKSLDIQTQVRLATVACALERFLLEHQRYPETLGELSPRFLASPATDPMTGHPWIYERTGNRAFRLYSVGRNGTDDGGFHTRGTLRSQSPKDDVAWVVAEQLPPLPEIIFDPPTPPGVDGAQLSPDLLRRYGLEPTRN